MSIVIITCAQYSWVLAEDIFRAEMKRSRLPTK